MKKKAAKFLSEAQTAERLGISIAGVQQAATRGSLRRNAAGLIDPASVDTYAVSRKQRNKGGSKWKLRYEEARAKLKQLEYAQAAGELLKASDVKADLLSAFTTCRDRLLGLPSSLSPSLLGISDPEDMRQRLDTAIREALHAIARHAQQPPTEATP